jgi:CRISPR-associated protein Csb2
MLLHLTIRFLDNTFHGKRNGGDPEWPPSPFRVLQAIVAGCSGCLSDQRRAALNWLEALEAPTILAPRTRIGGTVLTFVPNNDQIPKRTEKLIRPQVLATETTRVEYIWKFSDESSATIELAEIVCQSAKHVRCLGWGVDMAVGSAVVTKNPPDLPVGFDVYVASAVTNVGGNVLRVPSSGSLFSLERAHANALNRIRRNEETGKEEIHDQPGTVQFENRVYASSSTRPFCAFELLSADEDEKPISFDPRRIKAIVGMVRGVFSTKRIRDAMQSIDPTCVDSMLLGHAKDPAGPRLSIMPLLSIGHQHADTRVRRIILAAPFDSEGNICHLLGEMLNGQNLMPDSPDPKAIARLRLLRSTDAYIRRWYAGSSKTWASVSPVLLPGFDLRTDKRDGKPKQTKATKSFARAEKLAVKSLHHAGISIPCKVEISELSWWPRVPHARNFVPREKLGPAPRYHLKLTFDQPFTGPLSLGRQRHMGLGVFAALDSMDNRSEG